MPSITDLWRHLGENMINVRGYNFIINFVFWNFSLQRIYHADAVCGFAFRQVQEQVEPVII